MFYEKKYEYVKSLKLAGYLMMHGFRKMKIISSNDKLPSDDVLLKMLSDTRQYFTDHPNHSWIEFNIDNSIVRNAENKNGILYEFGNLRKIT